MSTQIILKVLALRHRLRQRDRWTRRQLEAHQTRELREHTYAHSPFYGRFYKGVADKGVADRPLDGLPVLTNEMIMEHFATSLLRPPPYAAGEISHEEYDRMLEAIERRSGRDDRI
jgi:hypothetical protein